MCVIWRRHNLCKQFCDFIHNFQLGLYVKGLNKQDKLFCYNTDLTMYDPSAEVVIFLLKFSYKIWQTTTIVLIYWASCARDELGAEVCDNLEQHEDAQITVQRASPTNILINRVLFSTCIATALPVLGVWGDKCGRKPSILMSAVGSLFATLICMMATIRYELTLILVNVGTFVGAISGMGTPVSLSGYIVDITSVEDRTYRLAILYGAHFFGNVFGYLIAAILLQYVKYPTVYCVALAIHVLAVILIIVRIRNDTIMEMETELQSQPCTETERSVIDQIQSRYENIKEWLWAICVVLFKKRTNNGRRLLMTLLVTGLVTHVLNTSKDDIMLLFGKRPTLNWTDAMYGYYVTTKGAANGLCLLVLVLIMSKAVSIHDVTLFIIGATFHAAASLLAAFSATSWMVFLSGVVDGPGVMTFTAIQTMLTKLVPADEVGCVLAINFSLNSVCYVMAFPVFTIIYRSSFTIFPGLILVLMAGVYLLFVVLFLVLASWMKRVLPQREDTSDTEMTPLSRDLPGSEAKYAFGTGKII